MTNNYAVTTVGILCTMFGTHDYVGRTHAFVNVVVHRPRRTTTPSAFVVGRTYDGGRPPSCRTAAATTRLRLSGDDDDDDEEDDTRSGMASAFDALDALDESDLGDAPTTALDRAYALRQEGRQRAADKPLVDESVVTPTEELKLYGDMYDELENKGGEDALYGDVRNELDQNKEEGDQQVLDDVDGIGEVGAAVDAAATTDSDSLYTKEDQDDFMNRAIAEALQEAKDAVPAEGAAALSDSILDDKELMRDIEAIFDDANRKLMQGVEDIRTEQKQLTDASATARLESSKDDGIRLAAAQGSISRLLDKVDQETAGVQAAVQELESAKEELDANPLVKVSNLRSAGVVKQSSFVLGLLFAIRSSTDLVLIIGDGVGNAQSHVVAAVVQAGIALACAAVFFL